MKHILIIIIAAVLVVGCGDSAELAKLKEERKRLVDRNDDLKMEVEVTGDRLEIIASESIHLAAGMGDIEEVKKHIADGTDVNTRDHFGRTPLHCVAFAQHLAWQEMVELLIAEGVGVNAKDDKGETPLDTAIRVHETVDRTPIMEFLRKHGCKTKKELEAAGN